MVGARTPDRPGKCASELVACSGRLTVWTASVAFMVSSWWAAHHHTFAQDEGAHSDREQGDDVVGHRRAASVSAVVPVGTTGERTVRIGAVVGA